MTIPNTRLPEYQIWVQMKQRCLNPKSQNFPRYGGRGIRVCERWRNSFRAFYADLGARPRVGLSLDRKDNSGHYSCGKCSDCQANSWLMNARWATRQQQQTNLRSNVRITHNGEMLCISEWARRASVPVSASALWRRIFVSKWDMDKALSTPTDQANEAIERRDRVRLTVEGVSYTAKEWAQISGLPYSTVYNHAKRQLNPAKA